MEIEKFLSGYCRQIDAARMVEVVVSDGEVEEADCCYGSCAFQSVCAIAREIEELKQA